MAYHVFLRAASGNKMLSIFFRRRQNTTPSIRTRKRLEAAESRAVGKRSSKTRVKSKIAQHARENKTYPLADASRPTPCRPQTAWQGHEVEKARESERNSGKFTAFPVVRAYPYHSCFRPFRIQPEFGGRNSSGNRGRRHTGRRKVDGGRSKLGAKQGAFRLIRRNEMHPPAGIPRAIP